MKHTDRIQKYLDGKMSNDELNEFRNDLQKDPELVQELDLHRTVGEVIVGKEEERFRKKLNEAYSTYKLLSSNEEDSKTWKTIILSKKFLYPVLTVAAALAVIIYFQGLRKYSNESIFNKYLTSYTTGLNSRLVISSGGDYSVLGRGVNLYLQSSYSEASKVFVTYLGENPGNIDALFYNGLCYIYLNEFKSAIASFEFVAHQPYNYYQDYANFYLALCYIRTNQNNTAKNLLKEIEDGNGFFSSKAKKIQRRLR